MALKVRARKPSDPPSHPLVPHFHVCDVCEDYHRWECADRACVWSLRLCCLAARA